MHMIYLLEESEIGMLGVGPRNERGERAADGT